MQKSGLKILQILIFLIPAWAVLAQNRYIPPDPYSIAEHKEHFSKYMVISSGFLGPNGLPVPRLHQGSNPSSLNLEMSYEYYFQDREKTHDALLDVKIPIASGKAALELRYVPFEFYETEESLSRERRTSEGTMLSGQSFGDIYFGTAVQLVRDHDWAPDVLFAMSCKTASGTNLEDARHTDSPGYYIDLSIGKSYYFKQGSTAYFRWFMLGGFYAWQTYLDDFPQDDALFYGIGVKLDLRAVYFTSSLRGLSGYMFNGDQPVVYRAEAGIREGRSALVLGYEWGIIDYPFNCFRLGFKLDGMIE